MIHYILYEYVNGRTRRAKHPVVCDNSKNILLISGRIQSRAGQLQRCKPSTDVSFANRLLLDILSQHQSDLNNRKRDIEPWHIEKGNSLQGDEVVMQAYSLQGVQHTIPYKPGYCQIPRPNIHQSESSRSCSLRIFSQKEHCPFSMTLCQHVEEKTTDLLTHG